MKRFLKWFNSFELKRRIFLFLMILYGIFGIGSVCMSYFYKEQSVIGIIIYGVVSLLFTFQYIYVVITDQKEFERKLFKRN